MTSFVSRVKELGPDKNANKKPAPANGADDLGSDNEMSPMNGGRNQSDLALLCTHTVRAHSCHSCKDKTLLHLIVMFTFFSSPSSRICIFSFTPL